MPNISVVYLARKEDGNEPVSTFLTSYERFPAGLNHQLLIVHKGFAADESARSVIPYERIRMNDFGFDVRAYRLAAETSRCDYICFFNTFSEILAPNWLEKLFIAATEPGVGAVGATGSWESMYSNALAEFRAAPRLSLRLRALACKMFFDPFPNCHLRTNAILVRRELMLRVWRRCAVTKRGAYLFENGKNSFTNRILRAGLDVRIVGRDGVAYEKQRWHKSETFRVGHQANLLIADNQTRRFQFADPATQRVLSSRAWGEAAFG